MFQSCMPYWPILSQANSFYSLAIIKNSLRPRRWHSGTEKGTTELEAPTCISTITPLMVYKNHSWVYIFKNLGSIKPLWRKERWIQESTHQSSNYMPNSILKQTCEPTCTDYQKPIHIYQDQIIPYKLYCLFKQDRLSV